MAGAKKNSFAEIRGVCIFRLTALTRLTRVKACESRRLQITVIQYIIFFLIKKQNYICIVFCQPLAMNFRFFQNLSTFVNVCQRMIFHGCV